MRRYDVLTFDCYGTLIDWERGIGDAFEAAARADGVSFEFVVTAEQVGSYKPAPVHFTTARQRIAGARWLHVAQSWFHDVQPAQALGIPIAWINRRQQRRTDGVRPDFEFPTLGEAA